MAYKALYRTYRPNSFEEIAGQQHIVKTLQHAVQRNKIAHAYLFCGPRGTGKTSIAKIFAKTINCESDVRKPCLVCNNCKAVTNGSHPDVIEIDAASNNGVEEVRSLIENVKYAPLEGKYKIYIIDEVHMMSTGAFNALLKTIEEPPEHVIFILATTEPHKVLPTIISRCQRFDFTKVSKDEIVNRIHTILEAEQIRCDEEVLRVISQLADGGLRDALSILDQCIAYAQDDIKIDHISEIYGITTIGEKINLFQMIYNQDVVSLINKVGCLIEKGTDIKRLTVDLIEILKESIMFEYTKDSTLLQILSNEEVNSVITGKTTKARFEMIDILIDTYDKYRTAANVSTYFEVCLLKMIDLRGSENTNDRNEHTNLPKSKNEIKPLFNKRDVSRETSKVETSVISTPEPIAEMEENFDSELVLEESFQIDMDAKKVSKATVPLNEEFLLGLLAGATKPEKENDTRKMQQIENYLIDFKWARFANLLKNGRIVGSGINYIVLSVDNQPQANEINEKDSKNELSDFLHELLGKSKKVFAISKEQQINVINRFKERMYDGTLPIPIQIKDVIIKNEKIREKTQVEAVIDLFGNENITITEN